MFKGRDTTCTGWQYGVFLITIILSVSYAATLPWLKKTIEIRNVQCGNLQINNNVYYKAACIINYNRTLRLYSCKLLTTFLTRWGDFRQFHLLAYTILTLCNFSTVSISSCQRWEDIGCKQERCSISYNHVSLDQQYTSLNFSSTMNKMAPVMCTL